jgi:peptide/nickel transport system substrate-binding protein
VADQGDDAVVRIDPSSSAVTQSIPVGRSPTGLAVGNGAVWVANSRDGTVSRIDPSTNQVTRTIPVGGSPQRVVVGGGRVWVSVERPLSVYASGGVVRVDAPAQIIASLDPALAFDPWSWSILYTTCAKLLNYPDRPAPAGSRLEPEVAAALPTSLDGGRTYRFAIRKGFRFSPPSNEPVTAETFRYAIERTLSPRINSPARSYAADIVGVAAYEAGHARHISGVSVTGNRLTIRLTHPAPDILARLALPFFCAVPRDTPVNPKGVAFAPGAGPYYVASFTPEQGAVLKPNPNYRGSRPHTAREIDYRVGLSPDQEIHEVETGAADFAAGGVPQQATARLARAYGPGSKAARDGHQRYFVNTTLNTTYLALNASRPLFADARVRQAVNYALDRKTLARIAGFGYAIATPTDQLLPPGMPGFRPTHVYPSTPDLASARRLARGRGGHAVLYTCSFAPCREAAQVVQADLKPIGIDVEIKAFPIAVMFARASTKGTPFDMVFDAWAADYADPADFFNLVYGPLIAPTNNINYSYFDSPAWNRRIAAAARLSGARRYLAYAALDADITREGPPYVAVWNGSEQDFFSARVGCQLDQPIYGIDLATLCIRDRPGGR